MFSLLQDYQKIYLPVSRRISYLKIYLQPTESAEMHRHCEPHEGGWAAGRHHRRGRHGGFGFGGRHGGGMNPDDMRAGRMLAQGDLRLIALALLAEEPRH